ncbi:MAG: AAA family ATPase [Actinomycetota bacterium]
MRRDRPFHAALQAELTRRLGVAWKEIGENGFAEIDGMRPEILERFSKRTTDTKARIAVKVERFTSEMGRRPTKIEQARLEREAYADERPPKPGPEQLTDLRLRWAAELYRHHQITPAELVAEAIGRVLEPPTLPLRPDQGELFAEPAPAIAAAGVDAVERLERRHAAFNDAYLTAAIAQRLPEQLAATADEVVLAIDEAARWVTRRPEVVADLMPPAPAGVAHRSGDGRPVGERYGARYYTTPRILEQEEEIVSWALDAWSEPPTASPTAPIPSDVELSGSQARAAAAVAGDNRLVVVVGPAGCGKTTALAPAIADLVAQGRPVMGAAPSGNAADELGKAGYDVAMASVTISKLLLRYADGLPPLNDELAMRRGGTLIIDEAGMVRTDHLADLMRLADARDWRLVLVGDPEQFAPVGRGGMYAALIDRAPPGQVVEIDTVQRFANAWEREASLALRRGGTDAAEALETYDEQRRLHASTDPDRLVDSVIEHWQSLRGAYGGEIAISCQTNATATKLNAEIQQRRIEAGELDPERGQRRVGGATVLVGDWVQTRRNDNRLRTNRGVAVRNRHQWTVTGLGEDGSVGLHGDRGSITLPADYVAEHLQLAYASTAHATQGRTVAASILVADARHLDRAGVYVPLTRGRHENHAWVLCEDDETPLQRLTEAVERRLADTPAIQRREEAAVEARAQARATPEQVAETHRVRGVGELLVERYELEQERNWLTARRDQLAERLSDAEQIRRDLQSRATPVRRKIASLDADLRHPLPEERRRVLEAERAEAGQALDELEADLRAVDEADLELFDSDGEIDRLIGRIDRVEQLLVSDATASGHRALRIMTDPQTAASVREEGRELFGDPPAEPERRADWLERAGRIIQLRRWTHADERSQDHPAYGWHESRVPAALEPPGRKREIPLSGLEPPRRSRGGRRR